MRHLLSIEDLDRAAIERICDRAASFAEVAHREIKKVPALRGRTVLTLAAHSPDAIVIRSPHAGAAALVAGWTSASVINAGDGKHEHPTQALLDVYTLRRRVGTLDGLKVWIVGDVLHSRVARSNCWGFTRMGA